MISNALQTMKKYKLNFRKALKALAKGKTIEYETDPTEDNVILCQMRLTDKGLEANHLRYYPDSGHIWSGWQDFRKWEWVKEDYKAKYRIVKDND